MGRFHPPTAFTYWRHATRPTHGPPSDLPHTITSTLTKRMLFGAWVRILTRPVTAATRRDKRMQIATLASRARRAADTGDAQTLYTSLQFMTAFPLTCFAPTPPPSPSFFTRDLPK